MVNTGFVFNASVYVTFTFFTASFATVLVVATIMPTGCPAYNIVLSANS